MKTLNSRDNQALCRHPFQRSASLRKERKQIPKNGSAFADDSSCMAEVQERLQDNVSSWPTQCVSQNAKGTPVIWLAPLLPQDLQLTCSTVTPCWCSTQATRSVVALKSLGAERNPIGSAWSKKNLTILRDISPVGEQGQSYRHPCQLRVASQGLDNGNGTH